MTGSQEAAPIAVQLYSVREALKDDFAGTVEQIAKMGYIGVETYRFGEAASDADAQGIFDDLGLTVVGAHIPPPLGENQGPVLETMAALSTDHLVIPSIPAEHYKTLEGIRRGADLFNAANEVCRANGLRLSIHNHDFEFLPLDGRPAMERLKPLLDPGIGFELDTYWIQVAGLDPAAIVRSFGPDAPLLHLKDGPCVRGLPMVALGEGNLEIPGIVEAGAGHTEWLIVELDKCRTDMLEALAKSYTYLVGDGLARGNREL